MEEEEEEEEEASGGIKSFFLIRLPLFKEKN